MPAEHNEPPVAGISRRRFLFRSAGAVAATGIGTALYTWRVEPHWTEIVERPLPLVGLPPGLEGKRLVQVSDLHVGPIVDKRWMINQLAGIERLRPDIIALTGDFMTCDHAEELAQAEEVLRELSPAPLGRFAVMGNHDYGNCWSHPRVADGLTDRLEKVGIHVLRNDVTEVGGLQIAGLDEFVNGRFSADAVLPEIHTGRDALYLLHNPDGADVPQWEGARGWILAGHTHGGAVQAALLRPARLRVPQPPVHRRRVRPGRGQADVHQPGAGLPEARAIQLPAGDHGLHAGEGVRSKGLGVRNKGGT